MTKGWFIGDFDDSVLKTKAFECAVKHYKQGDKEDSHYHKVATEYTVVSCGIVSFNGIQYYQGDIVEVEPNESISFEAITDATTFVIKIPSIIGDKYAKTDCA